MLCADLLIQQIRSWAYVLTPQQITGGGSVLGSRTLWRGTLGFCRSWKFCESIFSSFHKSGICRGTWCRIARRGVMFSDRADKPNWPDFIEILAFFMKHFVDVLWYGFSSRITASQHIFGVVLFQRLEKSTGFLASELHKLNFSVKNMHLIFLNYKGGQWQRTLLGGKSRTTLRFA